MPSTLVFLSPAAFQGGGRAVPDPALWAPPRSFGEFFLTTGFVGWLLLALLAAGIVAAVRRRRELGLSRLAPAAAADRIAQALRAGDAARAAGEAAADAGALGRLVRSALLRAGEGLAEMIEGLERAAARETAALHDRMRGLVRLAALTAVLGAFGTTSGLIMALNTISALKEPAPGHYAIGVAESLSSITFGLFFAAVLMAVSFLLRARATRLLARVGAQAEDLVRLLPAAGR